MKHKFPQIDHSTRAFAPLKRMGIQSPPIFCTPTTNIKTAILLQQLLEYGLTSPTPGTTHFPNTLRRDTQPRTQHPTPYALHTKQQSATNLRSLCYTTTATQTTSTSGKTSDPLRRQRPRPNFDTNKEANGPLPRAPTKQCNQSTTPTTQREPQ